MMRLRNKKNKYIKHTDDAKISIALMSIYVVLTVQYFVLITLRLTGTVTGSKVQLLSKVLVGIIFLYTLPTVLKKNKKSFMGIYFIVVFIFALHYLIFPDNRLYLKDLMFTLFCMSLPAFVYSISLNDYDVLKQIMKKACMIIFLFGSALGGLILTGRASIGSYSMALSYYMLLPTVMFLNDLLKKFSLKLLLYTLVALLVILALGSRGAVLCIIVFVSLKLIRPNTILNYQKVLYHFCILCTGLITYIFSDKILLFINDLLLNLGIQSRSISLFLREELHLSGRDAIYRGVINEIVENPLFGVGLAGDRYVMEGVYAHNIFIEILANFGIIFGTLLSLALIILCIKALLINNRDVAEMLIIWFSIGFIPLIVSGSYITDIKFWIFLGLMMRAIKMNKQVRCIQKV